MHKLLKHWIFPLSFVALFAGFALSSYAAVIPSHYFPLSPKYSIVLRETVKTALVQLLPVLLMVPAARISFSLIPRLIFKAVRR